MSVDHYSCVFVFERTDVAIDAATVLRMSLNSEPTFPATVTNTREERYRRHE